jgi:CTP:molybdopterin cytidylyltransferase MocA
MNNNRNQYGALILAGGHSSRMGYPKPWLQFDKGKTFLEQIVNLYLNCKIKRIVIVLNHKYYSPEWSAIIEKIEKSASIILNHKVEKGRLFSIFTGLQELKASDYIFIHNIDNPFIKVDQIQKLQRHPTPEGVTIPAYHGKGGHPVLISQKLSHYILELSDLTPTLKDIFMKFKRYKIELDNQNILINLNTESAYKKAIREFL